MHGNDISFSNFDHEYNTEHQVRHYQMNIDNDKIKFNWIQNIVWQFDGLTIRIQLTSMEK